MKTIILLFVSFLLPALLIGQENLVVKGQVTDAETHDPLIDCHVYVSNKMIGTITDELGNFELKIPKRYMTQCLIISHIGYQNQIMIIHEIGKNKLKVELEYSVEALAELVITPDDHWIIFKAKFDPYVRDIPEESVDKEDFLEVMSNDRLEIINTMY